MFLRCLSFFFSLFPPIMCLLEANQMIQSLHFMAIYTLPIEIFLAERIFFMTMQFFVKLLKSKLINKFSIFLRFICPIYSALISSCPEYSLSE